MCREAPQEPRSKVEFHTQVRRLTLDFAAGTAAGQSFAEDMRLGIRTIIPFIHKWSRLPENYDALYQEMLEAVQQPDYTSSRDMVTAWGTKEL